MLVAGSDSDSSAIPQSGIVGFGQTGVPTSTSSLIGNFLSENSANLTVLQMGFALDPVTSGSQSGQDSSGGQLTIFGSDPTKYSGTLTNVNVVSSNQQQNFGSVPTQLGSFDWTVQTGGWQLSANGQTASGGQGSFATVEMAYPYILLTQADAQKICKSRVFLFTMKLTLFTTRRRHPRISALHRPRRRCYNFRVCCFPGSRCTLMVYPLLH